MIFKKINASRTKGIIYRAPLRFLYKIKKKNILPKRTLTIWIERKEYENIAEIPE